MNRDKHNGLLARIQNYMMSYSGKTLINYFYSWGAAVVILGTLFKLTHLPGANLMLYIGMGTEVLVFIISGFDRPTKTYRWESVFPNLEIAGRTPKKKEESEDEEPAPDSAAELPESVLQGMQGGGSAGPVVGGSVAGSGPAVVYVGGGNGALAGEGMPAGESPAALGEKPVDFSAGAPALQTAGGGAVVSGGGVAVMGGAVPQVPNIPTEELEEATQEYLDKLKEMTETLGRLNEQLSGFVCDPEQMEGVNRHIAGLNAIFELQLRSASKQVESVDKVHEQTEQMAAQIEELNKVYARMLQAMTANMVHQQQPINQ
ncbi:MAG: gliding motility protein GldL [Bacteroidaceae bacterium]